MKRFLRILTTAFAAVIVAGTVASAAPSLRAALEGEDPTETVAPPAPEVETEDVDPEPVESEDVDPTETEVEGEDTDGETGEAGPDFSVCAGRTGLDNAICRHQVLLGGDASVDAEDGDTSNKGLENSLGHLEDNKAKHEGDSTETTDEGDSTEGDSTEGDSTEGDSTEGDSTEGDSTDETSSCPGKSCEPHGNGNGH